jgi:NAD(P)H-quinone oxidoreductase subunit 1
MVSPGLDLELSFSQALQGFGFSPEVARLLWLPLVETG